MLSNKKVSNVLGHRKEGVITTTFPEKKSLTKDVDQGTYELADMTLMEKKSSTKYFEKGTDELEDMKQAVVTMRRKGLYQFEGQSKGSKGGFKLDSVFLKQHFLQVIQNSINNFFK